MTSTNFLLNVSEMDICKDIRTHGTQHPRFFLKTKAVKMEQKDYLTTTFSHARNRLKQTTSLYT